MAVQRTTIRPAFKVNRRCEILKNDQHPPIPIPTESLSPPQIGPCRIGKGIPPESRVFEHIAKPVVANLLNGAWNCGREIH